MALISTELQKLSNVVKHEYGIDYAYCRELVTVNDAAGTLALGTVLGQVTVGGKYKRAVETAADGSKVAAAIVIDDYSIAAATDTKVVVLIKGPAEVSKDALVLDATYNDNTKKQAVYDSLEALNINVLTTN